MMNENSMKYYFSFDVESNGLFGRPFAVGWVIVDDQGKEYDSGYLCVKCIIDDEWVVKNVLPALPDPNCWDEVDMLQEFWNAWKHAKEHYPGIVMVTDCPFPVEAGFLLRIVRDVRPQITMDDSPYPIVDVASVLFAHGKNPLANYGRNENELPCHHPTCDARQSVRIMLECLRKPVFKHRTYTTAGEDLGILQDVVAKEDGYVYKPVPGYAVVGTTVSVAEKGEYVLVELLPEFSEIPSLPIYNTQTKTEDPL
jgi:hypothetical protein